MNYWNKFLELVGVRPIVPPKDPPPLVPDYWHRVCASSFADPHDVAAYKRAIADGHTQQEAFAIGDNGIGCWGDNTAQTEIPMCALPPDDMILRWGTIPAAKHKGVLVERNGKQVECVLADRMPWKRNIKNGCGIDLNPAACEALGIALPARVGVSWRWK